MNAYTAKRLACLVSGVFDRGDLKAVHVSQTSTGGRVRIDCYMVPRASKDIPDPETFIFNAEEL